MNIELQERIQKLKVLVFDVDGVLTDAGMYYGPEGEVMKKFHTKDGMGLALLRDQGFILALITGENSEITLRRAEKLKIPKENVFRGIHDKLATLNQFLKREGCTLEETAYMGDDLNDVEVMKKVSLSFAPSDAVDAVRKIAHYTTQKKGGEGAVREVADLVLEVRRNHP